MNANELAEKVRETYELYIPKESKYFWIMDAAIMLRQQQAEIEALKWQIDVLKNDVAGWFDDAQGGVADDEYFTRLFERAKNEPK